MEMIIPCEGLSRKRIAELADELRPLFGEVHVKGDVVRVEYGKGLQGYVDAFAIIEEYGNRKDKSEEDFAEYIEQQQEMIAEKGKAPKEKGSKEKGGKAADGKNAPDSPPAKAKEKR